MRIFDQTREFAARSRLEDERLHKVALDELDSGIRRDGLWAQALVAAAGDEKGVVSEYIKLRVTSLRDEQYFLDKERDLAAAAYSDRALNPSSVDHGSYFDWRGFFTMLGIALATVAGIALLVAVAG